MKLQQIIMIIALVMISETSFAQARGNAHYNMRANIQHQIQLPTTQVNVPYPNSDQFVISIKGLCNIKADKYVAIFSLMQAAETAEEVNQLIDKRIQPIQDFCDSADGFSLYVDMISFVPIYEFDLVKKVFNKKTYNEVPKGFEVMKNLHIEYKNPNDLNKIIEVCSKSEVYDIIRVDYFASNIEAKKLEMMKKAKALIDSKLAAREAILDVKFSDYTKQMADGFTVAYPVEMYKKYQTAHSNKFTVDAKSSVNKIKKNATYYYKPYFDKDFDFTINPIIFEPVIQVVYEIKVKYTPKPKEPEVVTKTEVKIEKEIKVEKEVIIVPPSGPMRSVTLD